jgi:hypothetical protein
LDVARIGFGAMGMSAYYTGAREDDEQSIRTIRRAIDLGVTLIDTAEVYGPCLDEELVGRALFSALQRRRAARAAARGRRAAPRQSPAPARLGRPRNPRRTHPAPASKAADAPARHPGTVLRWHRSLYIHAAYRAPAPAGPTVAGSKVGLGVMPIDSVTPSDGHGPGERSPTRR